MPKFRTCSRDRASRRLVPSVAIAGVISIIDDEEPVRRAIGSLLRSVGYDVLLFASAEAFLGDETHLSCTCVVSDIHMPGMSGIELLELLRSRQVFIPFVFITAQPDQMVRARLGDQICVLQKPFHADRLMACIESAAASQLRK